MLAACDKGGKVIDIDDNNAPPYSGIPRLVIENYVNRLFIDLVGREPTDEEMQRETTLLKNAQLSVNSRQTLINKLQSGLEFVEGDTTYKQAYYLRLYELCKTRLLEGISDEEVMEKVGIAEFAYLQDSLTGNVAGMEANRLTIQRLKAIVSARKAYMDGLIPINELFARMLNNAVYDEINMNTFNFIRASFNDVLMRYPTDAEFNAVYDVIEFGTVGSLLGQSCSNKDEYVQILTQSKEFHESLIRWAYITWLAREATTAEMFQLIADFQNTHNFQKVQAALMVSDEYAQIKP